MKIISTASMRELERRAMAQGISGEQMMAEAGRNAAREIRREMELRPTLRRVVIVTGKGNNAGDGIVAASHLKMPVVIVPVSPLQELRGEAGFHAGKLPPDIPVADPEHFVFEEDDLIVDALLGIGISGTVREPFARWIGRINDSGCPVIALDLPSGLDGDSGMVCGCAVRADLTITFGLPKPGLFCGEGVAHSGVLRCVSIGTPAALAEDLPVEAEAFFAADARQLLKPIPVDAHKNSRGRVLIAAGSARYPGAAALTALATIRTGSGYVRLATPGRLPYPLPAALVQTVLPADPEGCFDRTAIRALGELLPLADAVAAGPGWGNGAALPEVLRFLLDSGVPSVLDADALNLLAQQKIRPMRENVILTPHPGEAARLAAAWKIPANLSRCQLAAALAEASGCTVLLKGPRSVAASPDGKCCMNSSGTSALAIAGSGDVLTGAVAALLASGLAPYDAVRLGAFLHGAAGETVPRHGLCADDLPDRIRSAAAQAAPRC
ncbi:MAG: NAD(P)H-hydrate dehydratase [Lentisphaeria bacterium]|nr:NAD(P)H-hydrate dehydratase [Lentisphaeria bacterium]